MKTISHIYKGGEDYHLPQGPQGIQGPQGPPGPQGQSAVFDPNTGNILAILENTTGQSTTNAMTQKAVTDELNVIQSITISLKELASILANSVILDQETLTKVNNIINGFTITFTGDHTITGVNKIGYCGKLLYPLNTESGYSILPSTVRVYMGNEEITDYAFKYDINSVVIQSVTNNITIQAETVESSALSSSYTLIPHIISNVDTTKTSGSVIQTDFVPTPNSKVEFDVRIPHPLGSTILLFATNNINANSSSVTGRFWVWQRSNSMTNSRLGYGSAQTGYIANGMKEEIRNLVVLDKGKLSYISNNGIFEQVADRSSDNTWTNTRALSIFGTRYNNYSAYWDLLWRNKCYENNTLVRDYVPAKRNSDNAYGVYDLLTGVFHTASYTRGPSICINNTITNVTITNLGTAQESNINYVPIGATYNFSFTPNSGYTFNNSNAEFKLIIGEQDVTDMVDNNNNNYVSYDDSTDTYTILISNVPQERITVRAIAVANS